MTEPEIERTCKVPSGAGPQPLNHPKVTPKRWLERAKDTAPDYCHKRPLHKIETVVRRNKWESPEVSLLRGPHRRIQRLCPKPVALLNLIQRIDDWLWSLSHGSKYS